MIDCTRERERERERIRPKVCFIHVFKASGTTVSDWLISQFPISDVPPDSKTFRMDKQAYLSTPLLRGHVFYQDVKGLRDRLFLTVVRDPESRLMSALWHLAEGGLDRRHKIYDPSLQECLMEQAEKKKAGGMYLYFSLDISSAVSALEAFSVVGLTERLQDSLRLFAWKLGCKAPRGIGHARRSGAGTFPLPPEIRKLYEKELAWDTLLYDAARRHFDRNFAALCSAAGSEDGIDDYLDHRASPVFG